MSESEKNSQTLKGVVKWFNDAKGFGFIEHESGRDVFVHYSVIESPGFKTLKDGEEVSYQISEGPKGLHAMNVKRSAAAIKESQSQKQGLAAKVEKTTTPTRIIEGGEIEGDDSDTGDDEHHDDDHRPGRADEYNA